MEDYSEKVMPLLSVNAIIVDPVVIDKVEQNGIVRQRAALILQTSFNNSSEPGWDNLARRSPFGKPDNKRVGAEKLIKFFQFVCDVFRLLQKFQSLRIIAVLIVGDTCIESHQ